MAEAHNLGNLNKTTRELVFFFASSEGPNVDFLCGDSELPEKLISAVCKGTDLPFTRVCREWLGKMADEWGCDEGFVLERLCEFARTQVDEERLFEVGRKYTSTADLYNDCGLYETIV